jgi:hypothetical protein
VSQVGQGVDLGEQADRGAVAVAAHQAGVALVAALARSVQVGEETGGVAGALKVGDHGMTSKVEREGAGPVSGFRETRISGFRNLARPETGGRRPHLGHADGSRLWS